MHGTRVSTSGVQASGCCHNWSLKLGLEFSGLWGGFFMFSWDIPATSPLPSVIFLSYLSRSLADCWGTAVDFTTSFLHSSQFSSFRSMVFHSRPVHSLTVMKLMIVPELTFSLKWYQISSHFVHLVGPLSTIRWRGGWLHTGDVINTAWWNETQFDELDHRRNCRGVPCYPMFQYVGILCCQKCQPKSESASTCFMVDYVYSVSIQRVVVRFSFFLFFDDILLHLSHNWM